MNLVETIEIPLRSGEVATIEMTDVLLEKIRSAYGLQSNQKPTTSQVKYFLAKSIQNALEKM